MSFYCYNCMKPIDEGDICPDCGFEAGTPQSPPMLPYDTLLDNRYRIGKCVRTDGDGFTYAAYDEKALHSVYIVEFFVHNIMSRAPDSLRIMHRPDKEDFISELCEDFRDMAFKLQKLGETDSSFQVCRVFEEYNTIYYVSSPGECMELVDVMDAFRENGSADWDRMLPIFDMLTSELEMLHLTGLVHRGIDPSTVLLCSDGSVTLTGFAIASARINGKGLLTNLSAEYAAPEQFAGTPYPDRTCDIYSACALMFRCATGKTYDAENMSMPAAFFSDDVPVYAVNAILKGLDADPEQRYFSMMELRAVINGEKPPAPAKDETPGETPASDPPAKTTRKGFVLGMGALFTVLMIAVVTIALYFIFDINIFSPEVWKPSAESSSKTYSIPESSAQSTAITEVPDFLGLDIENIVAEYENHEKFSVQWQYATSYDQTYPRDVVMEQTPAPASPSPGETTVTLTVSRGPANVALPSILGKNLDEIYKKLTKLGLRVYLVEVDETYVDIAYGGAFTTDIVLNFHPITQSNIVKAETTLLLFGSVERYPSGSYTYESNGDGTANGILTPDPERIEGTVETVTHDDGSKSYYKVPPSYEIGYTTSYTYGVWGTIVSREQIFDPTPQGGTVSETVNYDGTITKTFTPDRELITGTVTEAVENGVIVYYRQPDPILVAGTLIETVFPDGSKSETFVPNPMPGEQIPLATAEKKTDPVTGSVDYTFTPQ